MNIPWLFSSRSAYTFISFSGFVLWDNNTGTIDMLIVLDDAAWCIEWDFTLGIWPCRSVGWSSLHTSHLFLC